MKGPKHNFGPLAQYNVPKPNKAAKKATKKRRVPGTIRGGTVYLAGGGNTNSATFGGGG